MLKGPTDIIISRNKIAYNRTGNQGMTKAGTGDVLAGLVVGFLAKTQDLFKSAVAGSFINGYIGDILLKKKKGYSFIASDIVEDLAKINAIPKKEKRTVAREAKKKISKKVVPKKKILKKKAVKKKKK